MKGLKRVKSLRMTGKDRTYPVKKSYEALFDLDSEYNAESQTDGQDYKYNHSDAPVLPIALSFFAKA